MVCDIDRFKLDFLRPSGTEVGNKIPASVSCVFASGHVTNEDRIHVANGIELVSILQRTVLARWPDNSVRWCLVEFIWETGEYYVEIREAESRESVTHPAVKCVQSNFVDFQNHKLNQTICSDLCVKHDNESFVGEVETSKAVCSGPVRFASAYQVKFSSDARTSPLIGNLIVHTYAELPLVRFELTIRNPLAMDHPGGNWDLGAAGAVQIEDLSMRLFEPSGLTFGKYHGRFTPEQTDHSASKHIHVFQASSGGESWHSLNHIDRFGAVPMAFRGYRARVDEEEFDGLRSSPVLSAVGEGFEFSATYSGFWQNFPKVMEVDEGGIRLGLFPKESGYLHELQGGEQKTHEFAFEFGESTENSTTECRFPLQAVLSPEGYAKGIAWPCLSPKSEQSSTVYENLVNLAIEGSDTFQIKSEKIDQFGWRNFGDIYGDHEAVFHTGPTPMISHYNNQYDCVLGFAIQFMRTGDRRWWDLMIQMADHAWDIDTYHTDQDKLLYNHGLFWHTYHYADAHTSTHRSYPKKLRVAQSFDGGQDLSELGETGKKLAKNYAIGGGPAAAHNYNTGWMVAYWLTGCERYRQAAISAADYVMAIEDGGMTPFKWLSRADTGYSTCSSSGYYGPGRAAANSTHALLTGHELAGDERYLTRAAKLMRRTVHPEEDLNKLDLLNAELRWFYTMYLQALGRFVDYKGQLGQRDDDFRYGVASLLHYARWMAVHERPTLSEAEKLQYPTETWAAQDMRKWHILEHASLYENDVRVRKQLQEKADFFFDYVCESLSSFQTRSLCRPVILMLNFGWQRPWYLAKREQQVQVPNIDGKFAAQAIFRPQREIAIRRFKLFVLTAGAISAAFVVLVVAYAIRSFVI